MSSFTKRAKSLRRTHRERGQLGSRRHLGLLEKHKDYVLRARDYQRKQVQLKILHEKARNRNPDEFYYKMVNSKLKEGRHVIPQPEESHTNEQLQLMKTQDLKYIQMKLSMEQKKVERLRGSFISEDREKPNTHIMFVDSAQEVANFNPQERLHLSVPMEGGSESGCEEGRKGGRGEKELSQRLQRCQQLSRVAQKMKTQKDLMSKQKHVRIPGNDHTPATYRWRKERKK